VAGILALFAFDALYSGTPVHAAFLSWCEVYMGLRRE
jgi:hypothetical protein